MRRLQADAAANALKYRGVGTVAIIDDVRQTGAFSTNSRRWSSSRGLPMWPDGRSAR